MSTSSQPGATNPLDLPEIRMLIARHLTKGDLTQCVRVCRAWKDSFSPGIWYELQFYSQSQPSPNRDVLLRYRHHVHRLVFESYAGSECFKVEFPNLEYVELNRINYHKAVSKFLLLNRASVNHLVLSFTILQWSTLLDLPQLKTLSVNSRVLDKSFDSDFWELCTRLERLIINETNLPGLPDEAVFPEMKYIEIETFSQHDEVNIMEFTSRCPNIEEVFLPVGHKAPSMTYDFARLAVAGTWPKLTKVGFTTFKIPDEDTAEVLKSMAECIKWSTRESGFGPLSFEAFRSHFSSIQTLNLQWSPGVTSAMIQEILSSSPSLEKIVADKLDARDVADGKPWVCSSMVEFQITIDFEPAAEAIRDKSESTTTDGEMARLQRRVFGQLSVMRSLSRLSVGYENRRWSGSIHPKSHDLLLAGVDFRLCMGLDQLQGLRKLKMVLCQGMRQTMGKEEIDWISTHWTSLFFITGPLDVDDGERNAELVAILRERKINSSS
ncbi:MAG: hypothetical protein J3Q66DRAFT_336106 [Benniella sp.]|nr:MAG: hypothetical protein J3Q66DRAFT_336106 [Benniella sp.]